MNEGFIRGSFARIKIGDEVNGDIEWKWVSLIIDELKKNRENRVAERIQDATELKRALCAATRKTTLIIYPYYRAPPSGI
jgi:hypothetical protein